MTLPAFIAKGSGSTGNPSWPSHSAGDFGLLIVEHPNNTVTTPAGWIKLPGTPVLSGAQSILSVFYRFATSGAEGAPTITGPTDHTFAIIITYSGVNTGTPIHTISPANNTASTTQHAPGIRTFVNDCLVLNIFLWAADDAGPMSSGETNADLGSLTERVDEGTTTGNGGGIVVVEGSKASLGDVRQTEVTFGTLPGSLLPSLSLALQPVGVALQGSANKSRLVNTGM